MASKSLEQEVLDSMPASVRSALSATGQGAPAATTPPAGTQEQQPPAEGAPATAPATQPATEQSAPNQQPSVPGQTGQEVPTAQEGAPAEDAAFDFGAFSLGEEQPQTPATPPPAQEAISADIAAKAEAEVLRKISEKLGRQISSIDEIASQPQAAANPFQSYAGYSPETAALINTALDEGLLVAEDIQTGKLTSSWADLDIDALAEDALKEQIRRSPEGKTLSETQIARMAIAELDELDDRTKKVIANTFALQMDVRSREALREIKEKMAADEASKVSQVQAKVAERQQFFSRIQAEVASLSAVPGTNVAMDQSMKDKVARLMQSFVDLPPENPLRAALGNPAEQGSLKGAIARASFFLFPEKIVAVTANAAKNQGVKSAVDGATRTAQSSSPASSPVATHQGGVSRQDQLAEMNAYLGYRR